MSGKGQRVGYVRVSSHDQNPDTARPQLQALLDYVRDGDTLVAYSMNRLARNLVDLRRLVQEQTARGVQVEFVKENLTFTGEVSPMATFMLSILGVRGRVRTRIDPRTPARGYRAGAAAPTAGARRCYPTSR